MTPENNPTPSVGCSVLLDSAHELSGEIYGGKLNFGEVGTDTFLLWIKENPEFEGIPIAEFDLISAMNLFEEWVKASNAEAHPRR